MVARGGDWQPAVVTTASGGGWRLTMGAKSSCASSDFEADELALLDFKKGITQDPLQITRSWNSSMHFCNWTGVTCNPTNGRVSILNLDSQSLVGSIPPSIGNFTSLTVINLGNNSFHGEVPPEIGRLQHLQHLNLSCNYFGGSIPTKLSRFTKLRVFQLGCNEFIRQILDQLSSLSKLGSIPKELGLLSSLEFFQLGGNYVCVPVSLPNASKLQAVSFGENGLTVKIPENLGSLRGLVTLIFEPNSLGNGEIGDFNFLSSLANCSRLRGLGLHGNRFGGELPNSIGNLSTQLQGLTMGSNLIHGEIPIGVSNRLGLGNNYLSGIVPDVIGRLRNLEVLALHFNSFSGSISTSFGNLTKLFALYMSENKFQGSIPLSLGNCRNLQVLALSSNSLNGTIPKQVVGLSSISISLDLSNNFLTGSLPLEVGNLSKNKLLGEIPSSLHTCTSLERLYLGSNMFEGTIPQSLKSLKGLEELDLSHNNLFGQIPEFFTQL
ncbi:LRR receptor-like serine/threonine-protein kinase EFR [Pistacia vera]|uniref:LRR receptor-like serine/threonine-protein kinase EFR n=1 Tax=Pistacia vera TaxID=55513 RepID=UPI001263B3F8|nr:LRR receptor-like serine/threonine-protein kinase EFR [Pistacia vera]